MLGLNFDTDENTHTKFKAAKTLGSDAVRFSLVPTSRAAYGHNVDNKSNQVCYEKQSAAGTVVL